MKEDFYDLVGSHAFNDAQVLTSNLPEVRLAYRAYWNLSWHVISQTGGEKQMTHRELGNMLRGCKINVLMKLPTLPLSSRVTGNAFSFYEIGAVNKVRQFATFNSIDGLWFTTMHGVGYSNLDDFTDIDLDSVENI